MGHNKSIVYSDTHMKIYLPATALGALALCAEAIGEPKSKCSNFISINQAPQKASRGRRSPLFNEWGDGSGGSSGDGSDGGDATTPEVTTGSDSTTNKVETTTLAQTTAAQTTEEVTDAPGTTEQVSTASEGTKGTETTVTVEDTTQKAIVIVLDETGSMQNLGGKGKGRKIVLDKFGQFTRNLMGSVSEGFADRPVTLVTFNVKAKWNSYSSINNFPELTRKMYNPGYQTNLYDTLGCVISKYRSENPSQSVDFFVISDGVHKMKRKEQHLVEYTPADINEMVDELRQDNWDFRFYGASNPKAKEALKKEAAGLGFRKAELKVFDFNGKKFGALMKTMLNKATEVEAAEPEVLPDCKEKYPCKKGKAGKVCRKGRKAAKDQGRCQ